MFVMKVAERKVADVGKNFREYALGRLLDEER